MKQKAITLFSIATICLMLSSCVKDVPVYPDDPDFVPYNGASTATITAVIDVSNLTGDWETISTRTEIYSATNALVTSTQADVNPFIAVKLNNASASFLVEGAVIQPLGSFIVSTSVSGTYIQLSTDPFNRPSNEKILITNLTSNSMTWIVYNTSPETAGIKSAAKVLFKKRP